MKFGPIPVDRARGAILAHSLRLSDGLLKKGTRLSDEACRTLAEAGFDEVIVAQLDPGDLDEDEAAARIGQALVGPGLSGTKAHAGRVNIVAEASGVLVVDAGKVHALNALDEGLTLATLAPFARIEAGQLAATVKIIPYGLPQSVIAAGEAALMGAVLSLHPFRGAEARLVQTRTSGMKQSVLDKGEAAVRARLDGLGMKLAASETVPHDTDAVASSLRDSAGADLILILGASATSDRNDVVPAALVTAGGRVERLGMPVDPGNLLFLGYLNDTPVVGLPGCARSPALNGADWVLERLAAGLPVSDGSIAAMGVGGLLKEMPDRPHPRRRGAGGSGAH
ncbi:hypothetical protein GQ651_12060 [Alphaproteobacteria bacterium GH1-50]|uniref:MoaB/Mog domain-containing protein n=1 Tax=Kangsaoukella pontilimi TaxID=2691042 RepID=A0A7C9IIX5_9RHOB|nr:molybdopterin-binding protein [Kangsaoukella pontilimi]MXQ08582.1 hypothetical protein [Kangsaoukella pontilimi]